MANYVLAGSSSTMAPCASVILRPFMYKAGRLVRIGCCCASLTNAFQLQPLLPSRASHWIGTAARIRRTSESTSFQRNLVASPKAFPLENIAPGLQQLQLQPLEHQGLQYQRSRQQHLRRKDLRCQTSQENSPGESSNSSSSSSSGGGGGGGRVDDSNPTPSSTATTGQQSAGVGSSLVDKDAIRRTEARGSAQSERKFISRISRRLADSFPLLTADEIKNGVQSLLEPDVTKPETKPREDSLALLVMDIRERVEELMVQVGSTDAEGLVDLKDMAQKFKDVLQGDPATVAELRNRVLHQLEGVGEEIEELLEVKELSKARERLEKATAESTEMVFDSAVSAMVKGLNKLINEGKDVIREGEETETLHVSTYIFGESNEFWDDLQANGITPRRLFLYNLLGAGVALGGNLFGVTSGLLGLVPEASRSARLDVLYPVQGFKRYFSAEDGYELVYPRDWVGDSGLVLRRQRDLEDSLLAPAAVTRARQRRAPGVIPDVAFGPQGGDGLENVSVVKSQVMEGFSLRGTLGGPREAAEKLLSTFIAPPDSGKKWELLDAFEDTREPGGLIYQFEYRVQGQRLRAPMHNVGVVVARGSTLFTVTVLAPEASWEAGTGEKFQQMAKSFRLTF